MKIMKVLLALLVLLANVKIHAQEETNEKFKSYGKLGGYAFGDYYYKSQADSLGRGPRDYAGLRKDANAFELRRVYLGYDYFLSKKFSSSVLLAHEKNYDSKANRAFYIKSAYIKWKELYKGADLLIGHSSTPSWSFISEKVWNYRSIERTPMDYFGFSGSNDLGIALRGVLDSSGNFGYNLMLGNGTGAKAEDDNYKKVYGEFYAKLFNQKFILNVYGDYRQLLHHPFRSEVYTVKVFLAFQSRYFTTGVEMDNQKISNGTSYTEPTSNATVKAHVQPLALSWFARGPLVKDKLNFFVRTDVLDPDNNFNGANVYEPDYDYRTYELLALAGLDYVPHEKVHLMPNIWFAGYQSRLASAKGAEANDFDLVVRMTFYYKFK